MSNQIVSFEVFPRIVPAGRETAITLMPVEPGQPFLPDGDYRVCCFGAQHGCGCASVPFTVGADGSLTATHLFAGEQEHILQVHLGEPGERKPLATAHLYSLEADLFARMPYKGDLHMHSSRSDGREPPAHVAAACRRIGLDFMALTDHRRYAPSIEAQQAFDSAAVDMKIFRGEEVHPPDNPLHIINFGGCCSINEMFDRQEYYREVAQMEGSLGVLPPGVDRYEYASAVWVFDKIRAAEGLGIFCHPYWMNLNGGSQQAYYISEALTTCLFDRQPFDAYELLGGYYRHESDSNVLQVARYNEERAMGRQVPIVGVSDAHGCEKGELFGWYYTIVFSPTTALPDLVESIKGCHSVAVEALPGEVVRVYGPFRLVKFALYLIRHIFALHDGLCAGEAELMFRLIGGDLSAAAPLQALSGQTARLMGKLYGK